MDLKWGLLAPKPLAGDIIPRPHLYIGEEKYSEWSAKKYGLHIFPK